MRELAGRHHIKVIEFPGAPLTRFDIGWVDDASRLYFLADRSNARIATIHVDRLEYHVSFGERAFTGAPPNSESSGPNGVMVLPDLQQIWAGDGDSTVKVFDVTSTELLASMSTGGEHRVDELAYDPEHRIVLAGNDKDRAPFATLISVDADREVIGRLEFPGASNGIHQPIWDPATKKFYVPITEMNGDKSRGEIAVIDPLSASVVATYPVAECQPAGLALGPSSQLCVGCSAAAVSAGFAPRTLILDIRDGKQLARVSEVGGSDEVWYNAGDGNYYLAAAGMPGGAVLGVIAAKTLRWTKSLPTSHNSHSVAADSRTNRVFVPLTPTADWPRGGVGVYQLHDS